MTGRPSSLDRVTLVCGSVGIVVERDGDQIAVDVSPSEHERVEAAVHIRDVVLIEPWPAWFSGAWPVAARV